MAIDWRCPFSEWWLLATSARVTSMELSGILLEESWLRRNTEPSRHQVKKGRSHETHLDRRRTCVVVVAGPLVLPRCRRGAAETGSAAGAHEARGLAGGQRIPAKTTQADSLRHQRLQPR